MFRPIFAAILYVNLLSGQHQSYDCDTRKWLSILPIQNGPKPENIDDS